MSLFNPAHKTFLLALIKNNVVFLLIGGYAVILHGADRTTSDIDLLIRPSKENGTKVIKTFIDNGLDPGDLIPEEFEQELFLSFGFEPKAIDITTFTKGITFEEAFLNSSNIDFDGVVLKIIDIRDLIKNKLSLRRTGNKALLDKYDAAELQRILNERENNNNANPNP
ncbi:MAG: hypothetical protein H7329_07070 [Opitutaceae bacterium]|nr:hypothetical protein [Cytophagales bacterium]